MKYINIKTKEVMTYDELFRSLERVSLAPRGTELLLNTWKLLPPEEIVEVITESEIDIDELRRLKQVELWEYAEGYISDLADNYLGLPNYPINKRLWLCERNQARLNKDEEELTPTEVKEHRWYPTFVKSCDDIYTFARKLHHKIDKLPYNKIDSFHIANEKWSEV